MKIVETRRRRKAHEQKLKRAKRRAMWAADIATLSTDASDVQLVCHPVTPGRPPPDLYPPIPISPAMMTLYTSLMRRP